MKHFYPSSHPHLPPQDHGLRSNFRKMLDVAVNTFLFILTLQHSYLLMTTLLLFNVWGVSRFFVGLVFGCYYYYIHVDPDVDRKDVDRRDDLDRMLIC